MTSEQDSQFEKDGISSEAGCSITKDVPWESHSFLVNDDSRKRMTTRFLQDSMIKEKHAKKHDENSQLPSYMKQTVSSILKRNSYQSGDYRSMTHNTTRRSVSFDERQLQIRDQPLGIETSSRQRGRLTTAKYEKLVKMSDGSFSEHGESEDYLLYEDDDEDHGNILDFEAMRASVDHACDVHVPGVDPLRRNSPTFQRHVEGGVSPLPVLRRRTRPGHATPFSIEVAPGETVRSLLETRPPSAPGYTSFEMREDGRRNASTRSLLDRTLPHNNSAVALTYHDTEGAAITPPDYHHLREYVHASESVDSEDEAEGPLSSLDPHCRFLSNERHQLVEAWEGDERRQKVDSTIPPFGASGHDINKEDITRDRSSSIPTNDARLLSGVEIVGSPPTGLVNISERRHYEDSRSQDSDRQPNVKGSIILAGLFTGIAVIVGRIFTRKKHK